MTHVYWTICLLVFFKKIAKKKIHQTSVLNNQCGCSANEHPSQTYFDISFWLCIGQDFTATKKSSTPPALRKSYINSAYPTPSKADREALMFWVPPGAAVPALLFPSRNCSSSSQSRRCPFIQLCFCHKLSLAATTVKMKISCPRWGEVSAQRHTKERKALYRHCAAVCHLHKRSAVRNNCTNTTVSLWVKIPSSFLTCTVLPLFAFFPPSGSKREYLNTQEINKQETLIEDPCQRQERKKWLVNKHVSPSEAMLLAWGRWKPWKLPLLQPSARCEGENVQPHEEASLVPIKPSTSLSSHHFLLRRILRGCWRKRD